MPLRLNDDQERAVELIRAVVRTSGLALLTGYAGTGKSAVAVELPRLLGYDPHEVAFLAPTWRAVGVLKRAMLAHGTPDYFAWSLWGATRGGAPQRHCEQCLLWQKERGTLVCHRDGVNMPAELGPGHLARARCSCGELVECEAVQLATPRVSGMRLLIIDESSMASPGDWYSLSRWLDEQDDPPAVVLVGDPGQLRPVLSVNDQQTYGKNWSLIDWMRDRGCPEARLSQVMRTEARGILDVANRYRDGRCARPPGAPPVSADGSVAHGQPIPASLPLGEDLTQWIILAYGNRERQRWNRWIRRWFGLSDHGEVAAGEWLIARYNEPGGGGDALRITKHQRARVERVVSRMPGSSGYTDAVIKTEFGRQLRVRVRHAGLLVEAACDFATLREPWSYGYASTVHSAQGGQWGVVFYTPPWDRAGQDHRRLNYTGATRARTVLCLNPSIPPLRGTVRSDAS